MRRTQLRFSAFRELQNEVGCDAIQDSEGQVAIFPKTYDRSFFGRALTEDQLTRRFQGLSNWLECLLRNLSRLPPSSQTIVEAFLPSLPEDK